jgi:hypothetical protein
MIEKIDTNKIQDFLGKSLSKKPNHIESAAKDADASLQVDNASLIDKAMQASKTDNADAVRQAKELLQSGQLENSQNIREAAENIVDFSV